VELSEPYCVGFGNQNYSLGCRCSRACRRHVDELVEDEPRLRAGCLSRSGFRWFIALLALVALE
jgi:hypothetical protein